MPVSTVQEALQAIVRYWTFYVKWIQPKLPKKSISCDKFVPDTRLLMQVQSLATRKLAGPGQKRADFVEAHESECICFRGPDQAGE